MRTGTCYGATVYPSLMRSEFYREELGQLSLIEVSGLAEARSALE